MNLTDNEPENDYLSSLILFSKPILVKSFLQFLILMKVHFVDLKKRLKSGNVTNTKASFRIKKRSVRKALLVLKVYSRQS